MAATYSISKPASDHDSTVLRGVRRARYSFHFVTKRTRRWLLVQWVSAPRLLDEDSDLMTPSSHVVDHRRTLLEQSLAEYERTLLLRRTY